MELTSCLTDNNVPVWAPVRLIDGKVYVLESEHVDMEKALDRVAAIRAKAGRAQAFESDRPKFGGYLQEDELFPAFAAVYWIPTEHVGKVGVISGGKVVWNDRPAKAVKEKKVRKSKKAKARKKAAPVAEEEPGTEQPPSTSTTPEEE